MFIFSDLPHGAFRAFFSAFCNIKWVLGNHALTSLCNKGKGFANF